MIEANVCVMQARTISAIDTLFFRSDSKIPAMRMDVFMNAYMYSLKLLNVGGNGCIFTCI